MKSPCNSARLLSAPSPAEDGGYFPLSGEEL